MTETPAGCQVDHLAEVRAALADCKHGRPGRNFDRLVALMARVEELADHIDANRLVLAPAALVTGARDFVRAVAQNVIVAEDFAEGNEAFNHLSVPPARSPPSWGSLPAR